MSPLTYGLCLLFISGALCSSCTDPEITATTYTTEDGTVITNVAYITEFTMKCRNGATEVPLYAAVNGNLLRVVHFGKENYQVSWVEEVSKARSGARAIDLFDEEGYAQLRKAQRNNEAPSNVSPMATIVVNHPGTYQGPWLNTEFIASVLSVAVWYFAYSAKSKLVS